jgi:hypothetical protein
MSNPWEDALNRILGKDEEEARPKPPWAAFAKPANEPLEIEGEPSLYPALAPMDPAQRLAWLATRPDTSQKKEGERFGESLRRSLEEAERATVATALSGGASLAGLAGDLLSSETLFGEGGKLTPVLGSVLSNTATVAKGLAEQVAPEDEAGFGERLRDRPVTTLLRTGGEAAAGSAPALLATAGGTALGGPAVGVAAGLAVAMPMEGRGAYESALEHGADKDTAVAIGIGVGTLAGVLETIGAKGVARLAARQATGGVTKKLAQMGGTSTLENVTRLVKKEGSASLAKKLLTGAGGEVTQEIGTEVTQELLAIAGDRMAIQASGVDVEARLDELNSTIWDRLGQAGTGALLLSGSAAGGGKAVRSQVQRAQTRALEAAQGLAQAEKAQLEEGMAGPVADLLGLVKEHGFDELAPSGDVADTAWWQLKRRELIEKGGDLFMNGGVEGSGGRYARPDAPLDVWSMTESVADLPSAEWTLHEGGGINSRPVGVGTAEEAQAFLGGAGKRSRGWNETAQRQHRRDLVEAETTPSSHTLLREKLRAMATEGMPSEIKRVLLADQRLDPTSVSLANPTNRAELAGEAVAQGIIPVKEAKGSTWADRLDRRFWGGEELFVAKLRAQEGTKAKAFGEGVATNISNKRTRTNQAKAVNRQDLVNPWTLETIARSPAKYAETLSTMWHEELEPAGVDISEDVAFGDELFSSPAAKDLKRTSPFSYVAETVRATLSVQEDYELSVRPVEGMISEFQALAEIEASGEAMRTRLEVPARIRAGMEIEGEAQGRGLQVERAERGFRSAAGKMGIPTAAVNEILSLPPRQGLKRARLRGLAAQYQALADARQGALSPTTAENQALRNILGQGFSGTPSFSAPEEMLGARAGHLPNRPGELSPRLGRLITEVALRHAPSEHPDVRKAYRDMLVFAAEKMGFRPGLALRPIVRDEGSGDVRQLAFDALQVPADTFSIGPETGQVLGIRKEFSRPDFDRAQEYLEKARDKVWFDAVKALAEERSHWGAATQIMPLVESGVMSRAEAERIIEKRQFHASLFKPEADEQMPDLRRRVRGVRLGEHELPIAVDTQRAPSVMFRAAQQQSLNTMGRIALRLDRAGQGQIMETADVRLEPDPDWQPAGPKTKTKEREGFMRDRLGQVWVPLDFYDRSDPATPEDEVKRTLWMPKELAAVWTSMPTISQEATLAVFDKVAQFSAGLFRAGTVEHPAFAVFAALRDVGEQILNAHRAGQRIPLGRSLRHILSDSELYQLYKAGGGGLGSLANPFLEETPALARRGETTSLFERADVEAMLNTAKVGKKMEALLRKPGVETQAWYRAVRDAPAANKGSAIMLPFIYYADMSSDWVRFAAWMKEMERSGQTDLAAQEARERGLDFAKGEGGLAKGLTRRVPFASPAALGVRKFAEVLRRRPLTAAVAIGAYVGVEALHWMLRHDDDEYQDLDDAAKKTRFYWWKTAAGDGHDPIWITSPRPVGMASSYFGYAFGRVLDYLYSKDPTAPAAIAQVLMEEGPAGGLVPWKFKPPIEEGELLRQGPALPSMLLPPLRVAIEQQSNRQIWGDRPIEPKWMQRQLPAEERARDHTPLLYRQIAKAFPEGSTSPLRIEHAFRGLGGTATQEAARATDVLFGKGAKRREAASSPVISRFIRRQRPAMATDPVQRLYDLRDERASWGSKENLLSQTRRDPANQEQARLRYRRQKEVDQALGEIAQLIQARSEVDQIGDKEGVAKIDGAIRKIATETLRAQGLYRNPGSGWLGRVVQPLDQRQEGNP